ncbi:MAG: hypothetical protein WCY15_05685 [Phenylobacterium sp.]|jgi:hypothetical protein|uniref:hypothetical protein n=1 Tax=Phenylobacterium sp. TaxID=1871053 RepID=UPI002A360D36|nr:hypothetical protein [Phenylobacterium sp.]MDX9999092.1 hypothetical protein [Phenylobacterium sp.]
MSSDKFQRNYDRTRGYLDNMGGLEPRAVLNSVYSVLPVAFDTPERQAQVRALYRPAVTRRLTVFDINLVRTFVQGRGLKIAICCMPKSGSTHIMTSLERLPDIDLAVTYLHKPYMNPDFVGAMSVEHEIDELSLLFLEMRGGNWVSHMHTKWTPYTERVFAAHNIRPIVVFRNIFDAIVSMDDMLRKDQVSGFSMIRVPENYAAIPDDERLSFLCGYVGPWYLDYVVSWSRMQGPHLKLYYEEDVLGFGAQTIAKLRDFLGLSNVTDEQFAEAFQLTDDVKSRSRWNQGVAGRGEQIPADARERLRTLARIYEKEVDFSKVM